jgi:dihydroflavonol-4-reductase
MRGRGGTAARLESHRLGTHNLLAAAAGAGVRRFVYISSVAALGIPTQPPSVSDAGVRPLDENHRWQGDPAAWPYGFVKHQAEEGVRQAAQQGLGALIVNPSLVIGAGDRNRVSNILIWHILLGRVPPLIPGGLNVVAVEDVAAGAAAALAHGRPGERYILCGENRTHADLIRTTARLLGRAEPHLQLPLRPTRAVAAAIGATAGALRLPFAPELSAGRRVLTAAGTRPALAGARAAAPYEPARWPRPWYRQHSLR